LVWRKKLRKKKPASMVECGQKKGGLKMEVSLGGQHTMGKVLNIGNLGKPKGSIRAAEKKKRRRVASP